MKTRDDYLKLITETLLEVYGNTLWETGTDIKMAKAVYKKLSSYLPVKKAKHNKQNWKAWRLKLLDDICNVDLELLDSRDIYGDSK